MDLPENTGMNKYVIELIDGKQPPYGPIYAFSPVKLEILKAYIETHLKLGLLSLPSLLQVLPSFLTKNLMVAFTCV